MRYYPDRAMTAARRGLAEYAGLPSENILPAPGGVAAIDLALSMRRGRVWIERPTFGEYARRAAAHCRPVADAEARCGPEDTVMLCNPNNPTGAVLTRDGVLKRAERIAQRGGELIVDEAFIDMSVEEDKMRRREIVVDALRKQIQTFERTKSRRGDTIEKLKKEMEERQALVEKLEEDNKDSELLINAYIDFVKRELGEKS